MKPIVLMYMYLHSCFWCSCFTLILLYCTQLVQQQCWFQGNRSDYCYTARWLGNVLHYSVSAICCAFHISLLKYLHKSVVAICCTFHTGSDNGILTLNICPQSTRLTRSPFFNHSPHVLFPLSSSSRMDLTRSFSMSLLKLSAFEDALITIVLVNLFGFSLSLFSFYPHHLMSP